MAGAPRQDLHCRAAEAYPAIRFVLHVVRQLMARYIDRVAREIAALLVREGIDYAQSKAVLAARQRAGLRFP